jgi:hypothetical protein
VRRKRRTRQTRRMRLPQPLKRIKSLNNPRTKPMMERINKKPLKRYKNKTKLSST